MYITLRNRNKNNFEAPKNFVTKEMSTVSYFVFILKLFFKGHKTFRPYYDTNMMVIINEEGGPAGTRILAPLPSWLRDPKEHKKYEQLKFQDIQINKILAVCPRFV